MEDLITIEFPPTVSQAELQSFKAEVQKLSGVEDTGTLTDRSIDAASIGIWVQVVTGVLTAVGTGVPIIQKIIELTQGKKLKGVKITLPNGSTVAADEISTKDLEKLIQMASQPPAAKPAGTTG